MKTSRWISSTAVVVLAFGLVLAARQWGPRRAAPPAASAPDTSGGVCGRALRQIPGYVDSAAIKARWVDDIGGVDLGGLDAGRREIFIRHANAERCTCGCGYTLAACRAFDATCETSLPLVERLRDSVRAGLITTAAGLRERPAEARR